MASRIGSMILLILLLNIVWEQHPDASKNVLEDSALFMALKLNSNLYLSRNSALHWRSSVESSAMFEAEGGNLPYNTKPHWPFCVCFRF